MGVTDCRVPGVRSTGGDVRGRCDVRGFGEIAKLIP